MKTKQEIINTTGITEKDITNYRNNMTIHQSSLISSYNDGKVLKNRNNLAFKLLGKHYVANVNRAGIYCFDDPSWCEAKEQGFWYKLKLVLSNSVRIVRYRKKAILAGVE